MWWLLVVITLVIYDDTTNTLAVDTIAFETAAECQQALIQRVQEPRSMETRRLSPDYRLTLLCTQNVSNSER